MPRTEITEDRPYQRFQGINLNDDSERNEAHDICNLVIDKEGRLANVPAPTQISSLVTGNPKSAYWFLTKSGTEVEANIDNICAVPTATEVTDDGSDVTITGTNLKYAETVVLIRKRTGKHAELLVSGTDYDITSRAATSIVCDISGGATLGNRYTYCMVMCPGGTATHLT